MMIPGAQPQDSDLVDETLQVILILNYYPRTVLLKLQCTYNHLLKWRL